MTAIPLTGDYQHVAGFNLNGIDATPSGRTLLAVQSATGKLFTIDPKTGATKLIDLGGAMLPNGDGILLHGRTLYVVQNQLNKIAVVRLNHSLTQGVVTREITDSDFDVPTTIDKFGKWLYAVNARFGTPPTAGRDVPGRSGPPLDLPRTRDASDPPGRRSQSYPASAAEGVIACARRRHRSAPLPASSGSA